MIHFSNSRNNYNLLLKLNSVSVSRNLLNEQLLVTINRENNMQLPEAVSEGR